jgi:hypothetical protein
MREEVDQMANDELLLVNMIPQVLSGETNDDTEPNLAVNPAQPQIIAASAFTPDPDPNATDAPIYVSMDGGLTWSLKSIVPYCAGITRDITLRFASTTNHLYVAYLSNGGGLPDLTPVIARTSDLTFTTEMASINQLASGDQPYIQAVTVSGGPDAVKDRVYVGYNESFGGWARLDRSLDAASAQPPFDSFQLEVRTYPSGPYNYDYPQIRPTIHADGTIYALFSGHRLLGGAGDLVVVRDDSWAAGPQPFSDLKDSDQKAGQRVVTQFAVPTSHYGLSIAADPRNSQTVYVTWADQQAAGGYTLHVRRSLTGGQTWPLPDLLQIHIGTDSVLAALAVNSRGVVGLLSQYVMSTATGQAWETHLSRSADGVHWVDLVLARVPADLGLGTGTWFGDYLHLMAVDEAFYGVFSAYNTPDYEHFPSCPQGVGLIYQRNCDFSSKVLLDLNGTTPVPPSIDPFFFRVSGPDFYVRDWTDTLSSHDMGMQPSTNPVFYVTSDVWNRRSDTPGAFNANDQPDHQDPQVASLGTNYAFVRIHRNTIGISQDVTAHFLFADFGLGNPFQDIGSTPDPTIGFAAADPAQTPLVGYPWQLPAIVSTHVCLAVEISTPSDPLTPPSLLGGSPGPGPTGTDPSVLDDNNKAQRNAGIYPMPKMRKQPSGGGSRGGGRSGEAVTYYAVVNNAALVSRDVHISCEASVEAQERLRGAQLEIISGDDQGEAVSRPFHSGETLLLADMQPGEKRWIGLTLTGPTGSADHPGAIFFAERLGSRAVNGFAIGARPASLGEVFRASLELHAAVFARIAATLGIEQAGVLSEEAAALLRSVEITGRKYMDALRAQVGRLEAVLTELGRVGSTGDPFGVVVAHRLLGRALRGRSGCFGVLALVWGALRALTGRRARDAAMIPITATHATLLHKLDAHITRLQKLAGDPADILQTVRWQAALYPRLAQLQGQAFVAPLVERSDDFVRAYRARQVSNGEYPRFIQELLENFRQTAQALGEFGPQLEAELTGMERALTSPGALQKAHRAFLLKLQGVAQ